MRLRWTAPAASDLYNIVRHIQPDNPAVASEVAETFTTAVAG
jgi:plasmid stabilization system protein ParE